MSFCSLNIFAESKESEVISKNCFKRQVLFRAGGFRFLKSSCSHDFLLGEGPGSFWSLTGQPPFAHIDSAK